ncbi:MAG: MFS transporter [Anaerolineae bacterium]|nr:MFS transporter [Anaerolineae bacterium]
MDEENNIEATPISKNVPEQHKNWAAPFFTIWTGQALSLIGSQVGQFALVWWLTQASGGSATILTMATFVSMLPSIFLGPFIGALVDRLNRRRVMILADSLIALFSAGLAVISWIGALQIWHVYLVMFLRSVGGTFHYAAMQSSTSLMVPRTQLARVGGMNQTLRGALDIITPPIGAMLLEWLPLYWIMSIDVATAAFAVVPLFFVHIPQPKRRTEVSIADTRTESLPLMSLIRDVAGGFTYVWNWPGLFIILLMASMLNMMAIPAFSLLPFLIKNYFAMGALQLGWFNSAWGFGVVAGGLVLSVWGGFRRKVFTSILGLMGMGVGTFIVGIVPATGFWTALAGMAFAGFMNPIVNAPFFAILQSAVAPEIQGRVFTTISTMSGGASLLGMAIAGPLADSAGVQVWFIAAGVISILMGIALYFIPATMHIEEDAREREKEHSWA